MPPAVYERNPFPGPGLYLRVVGTPISEGNIELVRQADKTVNDIIKKYNLSKICLLQNAPRPVRFPPVCGEGQKIIQSQMGKFSAAGGREYEK